MDTSTTFFGQRLRASIQRHGFTKESFAEAMGVSRATLYNWFEREQPPPSKRLREQMVKILDEPESYLLHGLTESKKTGHLKTGGKQISSVEEPRGIYQVVADNRPERRGPSTRADCEAYIRQVFDAAESGDDPDNFPSIMARLKKQFPLDEWEQEKS